MDNSQIDITKPVFALFANLSNRLYPTLYGHDKRLLRVETEALQAMLGDGIKKGSSNNKDKVYHVTRFLCYLHRKNVKLSQVNDKLIKAYRNGLLIEDTVSKKRSINIYLRTIYQFIANYSEKSPIQLKHLIGCTDNHRVTSGLYNDNGIRVSKNKEVKLYPLEFEVPSSKGNSGLRQDQIPSEEDYIRLLKCIEENGSTSFIIQRDKLIVEIARTSAFRRGSLNSLKASQFEDITDAFATGTMMITPAKQKFGYQNAFEIPYSLAFKINMFVKKCLNVYLDEKKLRNTWTGRLFINQSGTDMTAEYTTKRISEYAKILGWPKGKVIHVFRHLFAIEEIESVYKTQLERTDDPAVARSIARIATKDSLGHLSDESQETYLTHSYQLGVEDIEEKQIAVERMRVSRQAQQEQELIQLKSGGKIPDFDV